MVRVVVGERAVSDDLASRVDGSCVADVAAQGPEVRQAAAVVGDKCMVDVIPLGDGIADHPTRIVDRGCDGVGAAERAQIGHPAGAVRNKHAGRRVTSGVAVADNLATCVDPSRLTETSTERAQI